MFTTRQWADSPGIRNKNFYLLVCTCIHWIIYLKICIFVLNRKKVTKTYKSNFVSMHIVFKHCMECIALGSIEGVSKLNPTSLCFTLIKSLVQDNTCICLDNIKPYTDIFNLYSPWEAKPFRRSTIRSLSNIFNTLQVIFLFF